MTTLTTDGETLEDSSRRLLQHVRGAFAGLLAAAFRALRCDGLARCDFFLSDDGQGVLLNEVNTMPGFTPISMFPKLWEATGLPYPRLIDRLVDLAIERHEARLRHRSTDP